MSTYLSAIGFAKQIAYSVYETLENTYHICDKVLKNNISGDFVETGVAAGGQIIMMKQALIDNSNYLKNIYACDSFEGIPMPTNKDNQMAGIRYLTEDEIVKQPNPNEYDKFLFTSGATVHGMNEFLRNLQNSGVGISQIKTVKGWFEYTIPNLKFESGISVLRMDGDNYSSTKVVLDNLYDLVNNGGYVIIDDWALKGCRTACEEFFESRSFYPKIENVPNATVTFFQKQ